MYFFRHFSSLYFVLACFLLLFAPSFAHADEALTAVTIKKKMDHLPVVIILPHQDDELFMAGAIQQYVKSKRPVYVVMVSDGSASSVRHVLNGKNDRGDTVFCPIHDRVHNPAKEGYGWLSKQRFTAARNKEFILSLQELGVKRSNIYFANPGGEYGSANPTYRDGHLHRSSSKVMANIRKKYGDGTYVTVSGGHNDHVALEEALIATEHISEKIFFPLHYDHLKDSVVLSEEEFAAKQRAVAVYESWAPKKGRFGIGGHSVRGLMDTWFAEKTEYFYSF